MSCQVRVEQGVLQGQECKTYYGKKYYSFEGIPYAKPPIGKLRFRDPQEPDSWTEVRDATKIGNRCCQINPYLNTPLEGSEDCLYLNVYTPSLPHDKLEKLPVLFLVHGGRLIFGYGDYYKPDYLLKNDVILVTVNYRLNILGFLCLNIPEVPGNAGLKDTIMALRWVNKNIFRFNGDPANVTVMGESAGGAIVTSYLTSKMADGLYHKVISESGAGISDLYIGEAEDIIEKSKMVALSLGKTLNDERSLYEFLSEAPIDDLLYAFTEVELDREPVELKARFMPVVEKKFVNVEHFFDDHPRNLLLRNEFKKVPCLFGINSHEGALFLHRDTEGNVLIDNDLGPFISNFLNVKRDDKRVSVIDKKLREFYFDHRKINKETVQEYLNMISDRNFNVDIITLVEQISANNMDNVYLFKFQYSGNMNTRVMRSLGMRGASHGDVIQYHFYRKSKHDKATENDIKMVEMLNEILCNFAKNGTPSWTKQETKWPPYTPTTKLVLVVDDNMEIVKIPELNRYKFWQTITGYSSKL